MNVRCETTLGGNLKRLGIRGAAAAGFSIALASVLLPGASASAVVASPTVKASPKKNLTNNKIIKVSGTHWPASETLVVVQCNGNAITGDVNACDTTNIVFTASNAKGKVPKTAFTFHTGTVGDGTCNSGQTCYMVLSEPTPTGLNALTPVLVK
ncbi:MAG: hypothetical protein JWL83_3495 [Actinomycetia bacterium]|nr:hypothetical protein [Actinomycetes bacterium]